MIASAVGCISPDGMAACYAAKHGVPGAFLSVLRGIRARPGLPLRLSSFLKFDCSLYFESTQSLLSKGIPGDLHGVTLFPLAAKMGEARSSGCGMAFLPDY